MSLIEFKDYPSTETPLNAENLNHNFNELKVESGSNDNGDYVKFSDGTLICYGTNNGVDGSYRQITFPVSFLANPKVNVNTIVFDNNYVHLAQVYNINTTGCRVSVRYTGSSGGTWGTGSNEFDWIAIGKWK